MDNGKVYSKYHPGRKCGPCFLCGKLAHYYSHFKSWSTNEKQFVLKHYGEVQDNKTCICKSCYIDIKRHHNDNSYIPKWKKIEKPTNIRHCSILECTATNINSKIINPGDTIKRRIWGNVQELDSYKLCQAHYSEWFRRVYGPKPCASCGAHPKFGTTFIRHCPDPEIINKYNSSHQEELTEERTIHELDYVCHDCYMLHLEIVKIVKSKEESLDSDLHELISHLKKGAEAPSIDVVALATMNTAIHVAEGLLHNKAMLLPKVCDQFLNEYSKLCDYTQKNMDTGDCFVNFSARWLLRKLVMHLKHHLSYKCIHRKYGTLLFRTGGDLLTMLSYALGVQQKHVTVPLNSDDRNDESVVNEAGYILNDILHDEIDRLKDIDYDPLSMNIEEYTLDMNPKLRSFIEKVTMSTRCRKGAVSKTETSHTKKIRRFHILCQLIFCTNPSCPTPMHYLLADAIETCGGSRDLIKLFNKLGSVVSNDTYDRFVSAKSEVHKSESMWKHLHPAAFTVSTVDNFDKSSRHALVRCGSESRSYHGTTMMILQPDPTSILDSGITSIGTTLSQAETATVPDLASALDSSVITTTASLITSDSTTSSQATASSQLHSSTCTTTTSLITSDSTTSSQATASDPSSLLHSSTGTTTASNNNNTTPSQLTVPDIISMLCQCPSTVTTTAPLIASDSTTSSQTETATIPDSSSFSRVNSSISNANTTIDTQNLITQATIPQECASMEATRHPCDSPPPIKRRRTLSTSQLKIAPLPAPEKPINKYQQLRVESFLESDAEASERRSLHTKLFGYFTLKEVQQSSQPIKRMRDFLTSNHVAHGSKIYYMDLIDEYTDSDETLMSIAEHLAKEFKNKKDYTVLVGDGKTYQRLMKIKKLFRTTLKNLFIFPGDWHTLKNYQPVLMKAYYHSGLKEIAKATGFRGETLNALYKCSHFKRTHHFLLQVWEALYLEMIRAYTSSDDGRLNTLDLSERIAIITADNIELHKILERVESLLVDTNNSAGFMKFIEERAKTDKTWRLWKQFVFADCMAYVSLYLSIRSSNWKLRMSALKQMAPLFSAYDRPCYSKIIPHHLAEYQLFPLAVKRCLQSGGFTVSICGESGKSVAFDEAHEMLINKDMKGALVRTSSAYIQKTVHYLRYRIEAYNNLLEQLYPPSHHSEEQHSIYDHSSITKVYRDNIVTMREAIQSNHLLPTDTSTDRGLINAFTKVAATPKQTSDLLNAREVGKEGYINYIRYNIVQQPSTEHAPLRKHRLLNMADPKSTGKRKVSSLEKEKKRVEKCLRRRLSWCNVKGHSFEVGLEQYSIYPRAISDCEGVPHKGCKAKWTEALMKRYPDLCSPSAVPCNAAILDFIFFLHTCPLKGQTIMSYSQMLMQRHIVPHYRNGATEVHVIFDRSSEGGFNPKQMEQERRDKRSSQTSSHTHVIDLRPHSQVPQPWQEYINCRVCKHAITEAVGMSYMQTGSTNLEDTQTLILGGCFGSGPAPDSAWEISCDTLTPQPMPIYTSSANEADCRIWRHVNGTSCSNILVFSPDTDIYNIGLGFSNLLQDKNVTVQINMPNKPERFISLNKVLECLERDPDLASLITESKGHVLQTLFITSGCDYISYFSGFGKGSFLKALCQNAGFITGRDTIGSLNAFAETDSGFLAFLRLIGTLYFTKYHNAFNINHGCETPQQLYHATSSSPEEDHDKWINTIREVVSERVLAEEERLPSTSALERHWARTCWISRYWNNSIYQNISKDLPSPEDSGWLKSDDGYSIDWDSPQMQDRVRGTVEFLTKGCSCKKSKCSSSSRCNCRRNNQPCGPACRCIDCINDSEESDAESEGASETDMEIEIVTDTFPYAA